MATLGGTDFSRSNPFSYLDFGPTEVGPTQSTQAALPPDPPQESKMHVRVPRIYGGESWIESGSPFRSGNAPPSTLAVGWRRGQVEPGSAAQSRLLL
jgi:hypothetical protein